MIIKKGKKEPDNGNEPKSSAGKKPIAPKQHNAIEDFSQPLIRDRKERRRGDRRRGYRRIDDRNLISRAHEESNGIRERAAKEGFEFGLSQSTEDLKKLDEAIAQFLNAKELALQAVSSDIAQLSIKVAERIIKREVSLDKTVILNVVSQVLNELGKDEKNIIIKTNPADVELVKDNIPKVFPYGGSDTRIIVAGDPDVDWGSCIVETNNGMIDARFSTQLQILKKALNVSL